MLNKIEIQSADTSKIVETLTIPTIDITQAIAVSVTFRRLGDKRDGDASEVQTSADKDMGRYVKKLFCSSDETEGTKSAKCAEYEAIRSFDNQSYNYMLSQSAPLLGRRNVRLIKKDAVLNIEDYLKERNKERALLVEAFGKVYPVVIENAKTKLNGQFRASDYMDVSLAKAKFSMDWDYLALGVPDNLPPEVQSEIQAKAAKTWEAASFEIRDGLRVGFVKLVQHLIERLEAKNADKKSKFHDSTVSNILDFIDSLSKRNLTNDTALEAAAASARAIINSATSDQLKDNSEIREKMIEEMDKVSTATSALLTTEKRRKFDIE